MDYNNGFSLSFFFNLFLSFLWIGAQFPQENERDDGRELFLEEKAFLLKDLSLLSCDSLQIHAVGSANRPSFETTLLSVPCDGDLLIHASGIHPSIVSFRSVERESQLMENDRRLSKESKETSMLDLVGRLTVYSRIKD